MNRDLFASLSMIADVVIESTGSGEVLRIPRTFKSYEVVRMIGRGATAVVVGVRDIHTKKKFAAKVIARPKANSSSLRFYERELRLCMRMSSPYLVNCLDIVYMDEVICLIMEYFTGCDLMTLVMNDPSAVSLHWQKIFTQLCLGIEYLHKREIAHRDLKLENVLVDKDFNCKLCDYGLVFEMNQGSCMSKTFCGTAPYVAPEMIREGVYCARKSDIWALGVTMYAALTGCFPWKSESIMGIYKEVLAGEVDTSGLPAAAEDVVLRCMDPNVETRATIGQLLEMPFVELPRQEMNRRGLKVLPLSLCKKQAGALHALHSLRCIHRCELKVKKTVPVARSLLRYQKNVQLP